jgi:hypothetical protein
MLRMFDSPFAQSVRHNFGFTSVRSTAALAMGELSARTRVLAIRRPADSAIDKTLT